MREQTEDEVLPGFLQGEKMEKDPPTKRARETLSTAGTLSANTIFPAFPKKKRKKGESKRLLPTLLVLTASCAWSLRMQQRQQ